ncbi:hypothetical protein GPX89_01950 [Nocardia sp. ET3-3]|uniref:Phosphoribosyltransferase n=1 Tax=Nocardia terrae TaxID=2675851 RepID=A0A7K1UNU4_9NOCA|nr:hypothetical protein [Nocardia terrae]MVU76004.1 hypothetical protein [Nocardia terrae]
MDTALSWRRIYLDCDELPIRHIDLSFGINYVRRPVKDGRRDMFRHCLEWPALLPTQLKDLVALLNEALVLPMTEEFDALLALDWYKIPDDDLPPEAWDNTEVGEMVRQAKYFVTNASRQRAARKDLVRRLADAMVRHPALNSAFYVVSVPGHQGDGTSTGELIAADLAARTGKTLVSTTGQPRPERKDDRSVDLVGMFTLPMKLDAPCVIVDDVYRSGDTIRQVARVARQAGAPRVYGLAAAKTIRS